MVSALGVPYSIIVSLPETALLTEGFGMLRSSGRGRYEERPSFVASLVEEFFERGIKFRPAIASLLQRVEAISRRVPAVRLVEELIEEVRQCLMLFLQNSSK